LELLATARINGDIKCGTLVIAEGAEFNGKCEKIAAQTEAIEG
jgi:cytoskeletal protein CcmA (bactofilin family)